MTKPIEIIHHNFELKMDLIGDLITEDAYEQFIALKNAYHDQTVSLLCKYFDTNNIKEKCKIVEKYIQVVISRNFVAQLNSIMQKCKNAIKEPSLEVSLKFKKYNEIPFDVEVKRQEYKLCPNCESKMNIDPHNSELRCNSCDYIMILKGTVFDESVSSPEVNLTKRSAYETSRHCKFHIERILAIKMPNIKETTWQKIYKWLNDNNYKYHKLVTCKVLRRCLKEIKEATKLNEHVPFIRQYITGISPERLFYHETRQLFIDFEKVVETCKRIQNGERGNLKYYPYYIFKILEMRIKDPKRLQSITDCIHFQHDDTLVTNDRIWEQICAELDDFTFKKTDKNLLID